MQVSMPITGLLLQRPEGRAGKGEKLPRDLQGLSSGEKTELSRSPPVTGLSGQKGVLQCNLFRMQMECFRAADESLPGRPSAALNGGFLLVTAHRRSLIELRMALLNVNVKKLITKKLKIK